jgi:hypothetical protein
MLFVGSVLEREPMTNPKTPRDFAKSSLPGAGPALSCRRAFADTAAYR